MQIPAFNTDRLQLRNIGEQDIPAYEKHFVDYEVIRHLGSVVPWPYPDNGVRDYIINVIIAEQGTNRWSWGIFRQHEPAELIGGVTLFRPGTPENRGFWLGRKFWGHGYMTEAIAPVTAYAFEELGFDKLIFSNARGNTRSRRVKEKATARFLRNEAGDFNDPDYVEREIWELTRSEWQQQS